MASADTALGAEFGVSAAVIATLRCDHLNSPTDWQLEGHSVIYTPQGRARIADLLGVQKKEGAARPPMHRLRISRRYPSRIWVQVRTPDGGRTDLKVRDNRRLRDGLDLPCVFFGGRWRCAHPSQGEPQILAITNEATTELEAETQQEPQTPTQMQNYAIIIKASGQHHQGHSTGNRERDADFQLESFIKKLEALGHQVHEVGFKSGETVHWLVGKGSAAGIPMAQTPTCGGQGDAPDAIGLLKGLHVKVDALLAGAEPEKAPKPRSKKKEGAPADRQEPPQTGTLPDLGEAQEGNAAGSAAEAEGGADGNDALPNDQPAGDTAGQTEAQGQG